jgi:hypothetical protein
MPTIIASVLLKDLAYKPEYIYLCKKSFRRSTPGA